VGREKKLDLSKKDLPLKESYRVKFICDVLGMQGWTAIRNELLDLVEGYKNKSFIFLSKGDIEKAKEYAIMAREIKRLIIHFEGYIRIRDEMTSEEDKSSQGR